MLLSPSKNKPLTPILLTSDALGYDFAVLGLPARECRTEVIRNAAGETAKRIQELATGDEEHSEMLTHLATSTYRLLDPRRRSHQMERVHLSLLTDADWDRQRQSRKSFGSSIASSNPTLAGPKGRNMVVAELVEHSPIVTL